MMKRLRSAAALLALCGMTAFAQAPTPAGTWQAKFTGPIGPRPKMFSTVDLTLKVESGHITGTALAGKWPGEAPVSDGVIDGNHVTFTAIGRLGSTSGLPRMDFDGTIQGGTMTLTMTWGFVGQSGARKLPMEARRISR
jgi:hypothetical protein